MGEPLAHRCGYAFCRFGGVFVFPDAQYEPTGTDQVPVRLLIPQPVLPYLVSPVLGVGLGDGVMSRAPMPEATVEEHHDPGAREN
jgi:hypothetical protein